MRNLPAVPADLTPRRLLHPADNTREDPEAAVTGQARRAGYVYTSVEPRRARLLRRGADAIQQSAR